ncbi:MAG: PorP/SprF family type IX secretion system membrane protein [Bacteroidota bacterium]
MKKILLIAYLIFTSGYLLAQDIHFSQYYNAPLSINPSNAGLIKGKFRVGVNSKNQWSSVTKPFQTIAAFFDMQFLKRRYHKDALGVGMLFNADIAGDSKYSTLSAGAALTYIKSVSYRNDHFIAIGIMPAILQNSIDYNALYYDNQWNGNQYDPNLPHDEPLGKKSFINFDLSVGAQWFYQQSIRKYYNAGFSIAHLTQPKTGLLLNNNIRLDTKYLIHGSAKIPVSNDLDVVPSLMAASQGPYFEMIFGTLLKYNRSTYYMDETSLNFGIFYRYADALVAMTGFEYKNINFGLSYDINLSKLSVASHVRGGLEFSINYTFDRNKNKRAKEIPCPIF